MWKSSQTRVVNGHVKSKSVWAWLGLVQRLEWFWFAPTWNSHAVFLLKSRKIWKIIFSNRVLSTTRTYHDTYKHVTWIAGVPSSRATFGFPSPSTAPPPVLVSPVLGTLAVWIPNQKQKNHNPHFQTTHYHLPKKKKWTSLRQRLFKSTCSLPPPPSIPLQQPVGKTNIL